MVLAMVVVVVVVVVCVCVGGVVGAGYSLHLV